MKKPSCLLTASWALAAVATFIVVTATAIAARVQLRHLRQSNQSAALNETRETIDSPDFKDLMIFMRAELPLRLQDANARSALLGRSYAKYGLIDSGMACEMWGRL